VLRLRDSGLSIERIARQRHVGVGMVAPVIQAHAIRSRWAPLGVPYALHVCGNTKAILADLVNRPECACFEARDIGEYDTCPHGCVYCYAVRNRPSLSEGMLSTIPPASFSFRRSIYPTTNPALMNHFRSSCLSRLKSALKRISHAQALGPNREPG
jgi:hypothetical protein